MQDDPAAAPFAAPFRTAAVLGAGVMGAQIAAVLANAGLRVELLDVAAEEGPKDALVESLFARARALKPPPFFTDDVADLVRLGNFDEHWDRLAAVDWVVEAVVERMDVKRQVAERLEGAVRDDAVVSTNTSGLPIHRIAEGRAASFRRRFLGTHFFNPPRYMKLLELVPTPDTAPEVLERVRAFARVHLGKGVVVAKDTPNFIANRIGVYAILQALRQMAEGGYTYEEVDALTGPLIGHPKSATIRTLDVVGLDTMAHVARNLHAAVPDDESRDAFAVPELLQQLIDAGALGQKSGRGFYQKEGRRILSFDPGTGGYAEPRALDLGDLDALRRAGDLTTRLRALYEDRGRAGAFFRATTLDLLAYSARRLPEITDRPADLDRAIRWGFGYQLGPFETWDALGFERVRADIEAAGHGLPAWIDEVAGSGAPGFYRAGASGPEVFAPGRGHVADPSPADEVTVRAARAAPGRVLWEGDDAALVDLGGGVACYEFRSKANTLTASVMSGLRECIDRVERGPFLGLVVGNDGEHFTPGANLVEMARAADRGAFDEIDRMIVRFQETVQRVCYAAKPVVVATRGRVLGGGCELLMACRHPVAAAESYIGLVELGAGLIPAGGGSMRMAALAAERAPGGSERDILPWLRLAFETVVRVTVAGSAPQAQRLGFLGPGACVVRHADRVLYVAAQEVRRLAAEGYLPPPERVAIGVLGGPAREQLEQALGQARAGGLLDEYGEYLGRRLAYVMTGGDLAGPSRLPEGALLDLEREVFVDLLRQEGTRQRIAAIVGRVS